MDLEDVTLDAAEVQAGGDNLLNPVTMAATSHQTLSDPNEEENDAIHIDLGPGTSDETATVNNSNASVDNIGMEPVSNESFLETSPANDGDLETQEASQGVEDLGPRETSDTGADVSAPDLPPGPSLTDDSRGIDDVSGTGVVCDDEDQADLTDDPVNLKRRQRAALYREGLTLQESPGNTDEALRCYLAAITGLTEMEVFTELPQCLHQISNIYFEKKEYEKAVHFIQAEKMYYETALIDIVNLQKQLESKSDENGKEKAAKQEGMSASAGPDSPEIIKAKEYENLAKLCLNESKPQLALEYCGKATKVYREVYGDGHPVTVGSLDLFTMIYADVGKKLYADAMQKFDAEDKNLAATAAQSQTRDSNQVTTAGEETTHELRQRSKHDMPQSVSQPQADTDTQPRTEFEPAPQPEEQDDWVTTCLLMLLFLLITFLVLLIMSYFYCLGNERSSLCHQFKGDLSYWYMKIKHYYLSFGRR